MRATLIPMDNNYVWQASSPEQRDIMHLFLPSLTSSHAAVKRGRANSGIAHLSANPLNVRQRRVVHGINRRGWAFTAFETLQRANSRRQTPARVLQPHKSETLLKTQDCLPVHTLDKIRDKTWKITTSVAYQRICQFHIDSPIANRIVR